VNSQRKLLELKWLILTTCFNWLRGVVDALNQRTSYGYDELGRMLTQRDANNNTTKFEYDLVGQRTGKVLPLGQRFSYAYNAVGNLESQTDANGKTANMTYDLMNRLTNESYEDGTSISYSYSVLGQRQTVTDARGVTTYDYDVRERLTRRVDPDGTEISYTYDLAGNRTSVVIPSGTTSYTFDALNRLDTMINGGDVTDYDYNAVGNLVNTILPNGVVETRGYDSLNRLLNLESKKGTDTLTGFTYTLSSTGMRTSVTEQDGRKVEYKYDSLYRLTEEKITDAVNGNRTTTYSMDAVGNRLSKSDSIDGTTGYIYDNNDRLSSETKGSEVTNYGYDENGNTESKFKGIEITLYDWDDRGRLVAVQNPNSDAVSYEYNENGIRVSSTINGVKTSFLLDANRDYAQVLEEYNSSGVQVSYVYGHDLISQSRSGTKSFYLYDGLGTTKALTDSNGVVTDRYIYDAYGNILSSTRTTLNSYLYTGEQFDKNLGQYYLRDRYYSQGVGRFSRVDTFEGNIYNPLSLNKYLYTHGNPVNGIDPSGMFNLSDVITILRIISTLAAFAYPQPVGEKFTSRVRTKVEVKFRPVAFGNKNVNHAYILVTDYDQHRDYVYSAFPSNGARGDWSRGYLNHGYVKPKSWQGIENSEEFGYKVTRSDEIDSSYLPAVYYLARLDMTKQWLEQERFKYIVYKVNSNSAAAQWMEDLSGFRSVEKYSFAPGWNTDLRASSNKLDRA
jgi:RHS repeat-associated protein